MCVNIAHIPFAGGVGRAPHTLPEPDHPVYGAALAMLDIFRQKGVTNAVYGVLIVVVLFMFVLNWNPASSRIGGGKGRRAVLSTSCVAKVKGYCIDQNEYGAAVNLLTPRRAGTPDKKLAHQWRVRDIAINGLIERELLIAEAERLGLGVTEKEVTDEIFAGFAYLSIPGENATFSQNMGIEDGRIFLGFRSPKTKEFDETTYRNTVRRMTGYSPQDFRRAQERELLAAHMRDVVRSPVRVSDGEGLEAYVQEHSSASLVYVLVNQKFVAKYGLRPNETEIDKWAAEAENAKEIKAAVDALKEDCAPKPGHIRHILVKVEESASADAKGKALGKLAEALARIHRGEPLGFVAKDVSEDTGSGMRCGDVGDKTDNFVPPFKNAADALKAGELTTDPVQTTYGFHLLVKDDPSKSAEVESGLRKGVTRELYLKAHSLELTKSFAQRVFDQARTTGKSTGDVVASFKWSDVLGWKPTGNPPAITVTTNAPTLAGDAGAADASTSQKAEKISSKFVSPDEDDDRPKAQTSGSVNRGGDPIPALASDVSAKIMAFAFSSAKDGDLLPEVLRTDAGFIVVRLKDHKTATREEFDKDHDTYMAGLVRGKQLEALATYVRRLRDAAKDDIRREESLLRESDAGAPSPSQQEEEE